MKALSASWTTEGLVLSLEGNVAMFLASFPPLPRDVPSLGGDDGEVHGVSCAVGCRIGKRKISNSRSSCGKPKMLLDCASATCLRSLKSYVVISGWVDYPNGMRAKQENVLTCLFS